MRLESTKYLYDISEAAKLALQFIQGKNFFDYVSDAMLRSAVERQLQIVGEALTQLFKSDPETAGRISEYQKVIAFRDILVHGYADIDDRVVWSVLETKLPALSRQAEALLTEA
jgi:uncharacterized protein with HEPN domain